ncbi:olfactory receptor 4E1-like [Pygocentrus nattereri]|uniref:olfactory receptor 4E1-like n=1 Tax=Pygocentrus nattereri TaxID=42514 RepID=UPI0008147514|nr:olfactory receptor 4E1-like [Pygocentrus nattereri]
MDNLTFNSPVFQLEGLTVSEQNLYPTFLFFLVFYLLIMVSNIGIILLITMERSLHEPMYILFCNLPFNDVFGNSVVVPRIMMDIIRPTSERYISYAECVTQAFCYHIYTCASHTILMVALTIRLNRCGTRIANPFCDNASLFKLSCENPYINNVYGLTYTAAVLGTSLGSIVVTYAKIASVCLTSKNKSLNSKALKTCSTHLTVYLIMWLSGFIMVTLHRFSGYAEYRKGAALLVHIGPGILNPLIYALQSTEIRNIMLRILHSKKLMPL